MAHQRRALSDVLRQHLALTGWTGWTGRVVTALLLAGGGALPASADAPNGTARTAATTLAPDGFAAVDAALARWDLSAARALLGANTGSPEAARRLREGALALREGRAAVAVGKLRPVVARDRGEADPDLILARVTLGEALLQTGEVREARRVLDVLATRYERGQLKDSPELVALGVSLQLNGYFKDASRAFDEALRAEPACDGARLAWASLFASKFNYRDAQGVLAELRRASLPSGRAVGLCALPPDAVAREAELVAARVALASDRAVGEARARAEAIVAAAPEHLPAQLLLARLDLEDERPAAALARLAATVFAVNPDHPEGLALAAAAHLLRDAPQAVADLERRALAQNPRDARFFAILASHAERVHRYRDAAGLAEKGLRLAADDPALLSTAATAASRLGDDARARRLLERAHDADPYNVRVFNLLAHFHDQVDQRFTWLETASARLRLARSEAGALGSLLPPLLAEALGALNARYRRPTPKNLQIEVFPDHQTFSVRSVGLPRLAAHGVCFGHVVTIRSPSSGDFNWAEVLWHELAHVHHLALSDSRVPRWFTEGLAMVETADARPHWRRGLDQRQHAALVAGALPTTRDFNLAFSRARSSDDLMLAYDLAARVVRHIRDIGGAEAPRAMLVAWGARKPTEEVFREVLGLGLEDFDAGFRVALGRELAWVPRAWPWPPPSPTRATSLLAAAAAHDARPETLAEAAQAALGASDLATAETLLARTAATAPPDALPPLARVVRAGLAQRRGATEVARAELSELARASAAGVPELILLAELQGLAGDLTASVTSLEAAIRLAPRDAAPRRALAAALSRAGRRAEAWRAEADAVLLEPGDGTGAARLLASVPSGAEARCALAEQLLFTKPLAPGSTALIRASGAGCTGPGGVALGELAARLGPAASP